MNRNAQLEAVKQRVVEGPGEAASSLRALAWNGSSGLPADLDAFVARLRTNADSITDADVERLRQTYSDDVLFEVMVAASLGQGEAMFRRGLSVLEDE